MDTHQDITKHLALLVTLNKIISKDVTTTVRDEPDKNLKLAQKRHKPLRNWHVRSTQIYMEGDVVYLDSRSLFRSAAEMSPAEGYNTPAPKKEQP